MNRGGKILASAAVLAIGGCGGDGKLQVRAIPTAVDAGARPISFRVAEARGHLALGNVGLALESFRKAVREDPNSVDALAGMAACYDLMGRYDLSRRNYEAALALAPGNVEVLGALAASLDLQGRRDDALEVRQEIAARSGNPVQPQQLAATAAATMASSDTAAEVQAAALPTSPVAPAADAAPAEPAHVVTADSTASALPPETPNPPVTTPAAQVGRSVTVKLPPARPAEAPAIARSMVTDQAAIERTGPRLERISLGEIALITSTGPLWRSQTVAQSARSATVRFVPLRQASARPVPVRLLNAARVNRLAARTRIYLAGRGWRGITIGDASNTRSRSVVLFPAGKREIAEKLAAHFGFEVAPRSNGAQLTVLLGRDAARLPRLRPSRA